MRNMARFFIFLSFFLFSLSSVGSMAKASTIWYRYGGHEYALTSSWSNWQAAELEAVSFGGHLVTIDDAAENSWLTSIFADTYDRSGYGQPGQAIAWIGYFFDGSAADWEWVNGAPVSYFNHDYPLWPEGGEFAYLHISPHPYAGTWNANTPHQDIYDYQPKGIIERSLGPSPVPEPATLLLVGTGVIGLAGFRWKRNKLR
jgi:hypothetical protein